jgi:membrane protease YdiL (CAAX protease family)
VAQDRCPGFLPFVFPGTGQLCQGRPEEGATLMALSASELAVGATVAVRTGDATHPGAGVPLTAFQDLWVASVTAWDLERQRAAHALFTPPERIPELLPAPFSPDVLRHPEVWLGLLGMVGADLLVTRALSGPDAFDLSHAGEPPNVFGRTFDPLAGSALAAGVGVSLFEHVAVAEETFFRGWLQSGLSRALGETPGWLLASAIFGATHSLNALTLPAEDRPIYLAVYVPFITVLGGYLGWVYQHLGYSLAPGVALHFWYDLAVSAVAFALDPAHNALSASVHLGF